MADSVSTSSGVEDVDVEELGSEDEEGSSDEQEVIEEEPTENYHLEVGEGTDELQPLQLEEEEEEGNEGEDEEEQEEGVGGGIDLQGLSDVLRVEVDVLKSLLGVDQRFPNVLAHVERLLNEKTGLMDQYELTLRQFSENLAGASTTLRELLAP